MRSKLNKSQKTLPKKMQKFPDGNFSVCLQWVRCGKPNCRCYSRRRVDCHPAHYLFWREDGKLRKRYLPASRVKEMQSHCETRRVEQRLQREQIRNTLLQWRTLRESMRGFEAAQQVIR